MKGLRNTVLIAALILMFPLRSYAFFTTPADIVVSAYVGAPVKQPEGGKGGKFSLFGFTSPYAKVVINNPGMYSDTNADDTGYFEFVNFFAKLVIEDVCLTAQDQSGRVTMPVCIPPLPSNENSSVGPVIMPPTISLNNDSFYSGDAINLTGQTTPDTNIKLSMFTDESKTAFQALLSPIQPVNAATLPKMDIKVNKKGEFSMKLPSSDPQYYRTFAQTIYQEAFSPKSVTLNFDILPGWFIIMKFILGFLNALKGHWLEIVLFTQVLLLAYWLLHRFLQPHQIAYMRSLAIQEHPPLMTTPHELLAQEHNLLLQEHELLLKQLELQNN